jgi:hypothetical protein
MTMGTGEVVLLCREKREKEMKITLNQLKDTDFNSSFETNNEQYEQNQQEPEYEDYTDKKTNNLKKKDFNLDVFMSKDSSDQLINQNNPLNNDVQINNSSNLDEEKFISSEEMGGKSQGFTVIVDSRETQSAVIKYLALGGMDIILKTLPVGDYIISESVGIERKEAYDFIQSIKDGRLFDELHNLRNNFEVPIMILEGNPIGISGLSRESIMGAIASVMENENNCIYH